MARKRPGVLKLLVCLLYRDADLLRIFLGCTPVTLSPLMSVHEEWPPSGFSPFWSLRRKQVLQAEIQDETDTWPAEEGNNSRRGTRRVELDRYLSMFEHKLAAARALSPQEIQAIAAFLSASVQEFAGLASSNVALKVCRKTGLLGCCSKSD